MNLPAGAIAALEREIRLTERVLQLREEYQRRHPVRRMLGFLGLIDFDTEMREAAFYGALQENQP